MLHTPPLKDQTTYCQKEDFDNICFERQKFHNIHPSPLQHGAVGNTSSPTTTSMIVSVNQAGTAFNCQHESTTSNHRLSPQKVMIVWRDCGQELSGGDGNN